MRARVFLSCGALAGCGVLSGLDGLNVEGDASSTPDASDAGDALATIDVADGGWVDANASAVVHCGNSDCSGGTPCCITLSSNEPIYACVKDCNSGPNTLALRCDDLSDCTTQVCCFANNAAQCGSGTSTCLNALCANDQQCTNGGKCSPFDAGDGVTLSHCQ